MSAPELRRSIYNHFVRRDEGVIGYNARIGVFALLAPHVGEWLQTEQPLPAALEGTVDELLEQGFLCTEDELRMLEDTWRANKEEALSSLALTICPTMECNYRCPYCYEAGRCRVGRMGEDVQEALVRLTTKALAGRTRELTVIWYGGEPLLAKEIMFDLHGKLRQVAEAAQAKFTAGRLITNASLLDAETIKQLSNMGVGHCQVSFDSVVGDGKTKRGVLDIDGAPSKILRALLAAQETLAVSARVNVTRENVSEIADIIGLLQKHGVLHYEIARAEDLEEEVLFSLRDLEDGDAVPQFVSVDSRKPFSCLSRWEFAELQRSCMGSHRKKTLELMAAMLTPQEGTNCGTTSGNMFVIEPDGQVSRCWNSVGVAAESVGNILELRDFADLKQTPVSRMIDDFSPFRCAQCRACPVLPLCMGGCAYYPVFRSDSGLRCLDVRHQLTWCVENIGKRLKLPAVNWPSPTSAEDRNGVLTPTSASASTLNFRA